MSRRLFIYITGMLALIALATNLSPVLEIIRRIQGKFIKAQELPPINQRIKTQLNPQGETVSVELALNSRCTSDYNGNQKIFHWGLFDPEKKVVADDIQHLIDRVHIPRFTDGLLKIKAEENMLYFQMADETDELKRSWMMIESGMQQQVVCLLCAAFGIGMVFKSLGDNGAKASDSIHSNTRIKLDAMLPSYNGSYWIDSAPEGWRPWLKGNLPSPNRNGKMSLTGLLTSITQNSPAKNKPANTSDVSQLLWAARGRTPHYYKSKPWGMTIPVSRGNQNITSVFLVRSKDLFRYSNFKNGRPTHHLEKLHAISDIISFDPDFQKPNTYNCQIILSINENTGRAYWEIGYQLINIILQASALKLLVSANLVDHSLRDAFLDIGIDGASAFVTVITDDSSLNHV